MESEFAGKVVLVTGGGSGIGEATAIAFGTAGAHVVVSDVLIEHAARTAATILNAGGSAVALGADVSNADQVREMVNAAVTEFGRLDIAANIAGIELESKLPGDHRLAFVDEALFDRVIAVNLKGVWLCMKYEIEQMLKDGGGVIVNCTSGAGLAAVPGLSGYCASKHGAVGLTRTAGVEYGGDGLRINAICPGAVDTPLISNLTSNQEHREMMNTSHPMGRIAVPSEVSDGILFLASSKASFITGTTLSVDGGLSA